MSITVVFEELVQMLENLITSKDIIILVGDIQRKTDVHSRQFNEVLDMFNMVQHVKFPTHKLGHTLDIVATLKDNPPVINVRANEYDLSHHFLVDFMVTITPEHGEYKVIDYRNIKVVDSDTFAHEIMEKVNSIECDNFKGKVVNYNKVTAEVLEKHAPMKTRSVKIIPNAPWFDGSMETLERREERQRNSLKGLDYQRIKKIISVSANKLLLLLTKKRRIIIVRS